MNTQWPALTEDERAALNSTDTPEAERMRLYGRDLRATAAAYAVAADAPGLRKDAARFLYAESVRLHNEGGHALDRADQMEDKIWCRLRGTNVPVAECVASCPAPEQRDVCAFEFDPTTTPQLARYQAEGR